MLQTLCGGIFSPSLQTLWILSSWFWKRRITSWPLFTWFTTWSCPCAAGSSSSGLAAATQPSSCSSTWASTWWCTFTTSCLAWVHRSRSISGGKDTLLVINDQRIEESVFKHVIGWCNFRDAAPPVCLVLHPRSDPAVHQLQLSHSRRLLHHLPRSPLLHPLY